MSADLSRLFLPGARGAGSQLVMSGVCTAWDAVTHQSTVNVGGSVNYANLPVLNVAAMTVGSVLLLNTPAGPIILGPLTVPA